MAAADLVAGDRVALLVPGSDGYVDLVIDLLAAGLVAVPLDAAAHIRGAGCAPRGHRPRPSSGRRSSLRRCGRRSPPPAGGAPRCPGPCTSPAARPGGQGRVVRPARRGRVHGHSSTRSASCGGSATTMSTSSLSPLHHSAPLRFAMGTRLAGGRVVVPGPVRRRAAVTDAIVRERPTTMFCVPTHLQRLFAHWDQAACPTSAASASSRTPERPVRPRSRSGWSSCSPKAALGVLRLHRGPVHRVSQRGVARATRDGRPGAARAQPAARRRRHDLVHGAPHARFSYWNAPEKTEAAWRDTDAGPAFTVGDLGTDGRRGLPVPRRPARGPGHLRRGQRLPGRGRERTAEHPRSPTSRCSGSATRTGDSGSARPWWATSMPPRCTTWRGAARPAQATQGLLRRRRAAADRDRQGPPAGATRPARPRRPRLSRRCGGTAAG